jgi:predicted transcriptional regulator
MVRNKTYLTEGRDRRLKELAERYHTTEAEILRLALDSWLQRETALNSADPFERLVEFALGPKEVDHNDIYE